MIQNNLDHLKNNSLIIPAKIAGASGNDMLYDLKMENAVIIRKASRELITNALGVQMHVFKDIDYLDLLRNEVEAFRTLFAVWVRLLILELCDRPLRRDYPEFCVND